MSDKAGKKEQKNESLKKDNKKEVKETKKEVAKKEAKKKDSSSSSSSSSDSSDDEPMPPAKSAPKDSKAAPKVETKKKKDSSSSDSSSDSDDSDDKPAKKEESKKEAPKKEESKKKAKDSSSSSDDDEEKEPKKRKAEEIEAKAPPSKKQKTEGGHVATGSSETIDETQTKCFISNLAFTVDEEAVKNFFKGTAEVVSVQWFNTKEGKFRGCGLIDFGSHAAAVKACELNDKELLGRPVRINVEKPKPPAGGKAGRRQRGPTPKPDGCDTIFIGNLSYDIDDSHVQAFFADCGEVVQIRWPTREDGSFPGMGFVQFSDTDATDKAVAKSGTQLLGRAIRCDFASSRKRN